VRSAIATSALLVVTLLAAPGAALAAPDPATAALAYLARQQAANGAIASSAGATEDFILGAAAANYDPNTLVSCAHKSAYQYLTANLTTEVATAGGTGKLILAVLAGKLDPTAFGGHDLIVHLGTLLNTTTGAYDHGSTFGQSLAILALKGAGVAIPASAITELKGLQDTDGSWNYQASSDSTAGDTNSTAVAVEALIAAGVAASDASMAKAIAYLHTQQNTDGGFTYSAPGLSDPDSDALVIQALVALNEDPTGASWTVGGKTVFSDLLSRQIADGGFVFPGNPTADAFTTSQVPAGIKKVPLPGTTTWETGAKIPGVSCPTPTPTPSHAPAASHTPLLTAPPTSIAEASVSGDDTGPMNPVMYGWFVLIVLLGSRMVWRRSSRSQR
jgi:hypothetical protein